MPDAPVILYGCPPSLYTGKVRSYLRKAGIPFVEKLQSHPDFAAKIMPAVGRFVVPVLEMPNGEIVQDTTEIIDYLEKAYGQPVDVYPSSPKQRIASLILELFGDEGLLRPAMHYRWNFPEENDHFISMEFGRFMNPRASDEEAYELAKMPKAAMQKYLPALGITPETIPVIEQDYLELLTALDKHFLEHPYLLGGRPTIGDFGLYAPLYAHLARDPAPAMLMKKHANRVWRWVERMTVADSDMPEFPDAQPELHTDDIVPASLTYILKLVARCYLPELNALVAFINEHLENAGDIPPETAVITDDKRRVLGRVEIEIGNQKAEIGARHFSLWMLQRIHDAYDALDQKDRPAVDLLLAETGLATLVSTRPSRRMERMNFREVWA